MLLFKIIHDISYGGPDEKPGGDLARLFGILWVCASVIAVGYGIGTFFCSIIPFYTHMFKNGYFLTLSQYILAFS